MDVLRVDREGPLARITLTRPQKRNALSPELLARIAAAAAEVDAMDGVKVAVIAGEGRSFCAGSDLAAFTDDAARTREIAELGRAMAEAVTEMRAITIARVQGHCVGGGVVLAAGCDLRVAASDAVFSIPETALGIPLAWGGIPRLVREIGPAMTKELVLTCREFSADEARGLGFVTQIAAPEDIDAAVDALAARLADRSSLTLTVTKQHVNAVAEELARAAGAAADADGLAAAVQDPESRAAALRHLEALAARARPGR